VIGRCLAAIAGLCIAVEAGSQPSAPAVLGEYVLVRSRTAVCRDFTTFLNRYRDIDFDSCSLQLPNDGSRFVRPAWQEVPLDMAIAERLIKRDWEERSPAQAKQLWADWLADTAGARRAGRVRMQRLEADLDDDGAPEVLVRMNFGERFRAEEKRLSPEFRRIEGCHYIDSALYVLDSKSAWAQTFNGSLQRAGDIIQDTRTRRSYVVEWSMDPARGIWKRDEYPRGAAGAKRSIIVGEVHKQWGLSGICHIQWIPKAIAK
jgi:hypothetical protein